MVRGFYSILVLLIASSAIAQNNVHVEIKSLPAYHPSAADIYMAGSFNGWNPRDDNFRFKKDSSGNYVLDIKLEPGTYEFKLTRGGWDKVECKKDGAAMSNRVLAARSKTDVGLKVEEWQDRFPAKPKTSTASRNVHIADTAFLMPQLSRTRRIIVYLPENYASSAQRYPVIYMHDGQNLFDNSTAYAGEWGVDEFLDSMKMKQCIVVGIDNGDLKRVNEYCPFDFSMAQNSTIKNNKGEGKEYVDFLVKTLKPFIDKRYRTLSGRKSTSVAGSSMGGLISFYAVLKYPKIFGSAGVFSPSVWICKDELFRMIDSAGSKVKSSIYFYCGKQEGFSMVPDMEEAVKRLKKVSKVKTITVIDEKGRHNEATWRAEFPAFYKWSMN